MKTFRCGECGLMVFFENDRCLQCGHPLGFVPETLEMTALEKAADGQWRVLGSPDSAISYRTCANASQHHVCNWLVRADDTNAWCVACRLNEMIPSLADARNLARWSRLELAKRRCLYTLLNLGLPITGDEKGRHLSLRFKFLEDNPNEPVKTGHENGLITINVTEADHDERERRRMQLHEPYRTLVGHFRHETGHYYWDRLIDGSQFIQRFRELFGDETLDYGAALRTHYQQGAAADWASKYVTAYASSHPWEDWAETWAHYLHMVETLESAAGFRLSVMAKAPTRAGAIQFSRSMDFDRMYAEWTPLTCALNAINRSMGLSDLYPFAISLPVVEKLRFIHEIVAGSKTE
jgi:hypothetical protein